jgi:hypothetical protein
MSKASCVRGKKILDFFLFPNREKKKKELFPLGMSVEFAAIVSQTAGVGCGCPRVCKKDGEAFENPVARSHQGFLGEQHRITLLEKKKT